MARPLAALALAAALAAPALAQEPPQPLPATLPPAQQPQLINLSLMEALVSVDAQDLAGVFGFIPEALAPPAFADYLLHNRSALKRFIKKSKRDLKETGGINEWDRLVYVYLVQINGSGALPPGVDRLSRGLEEQISEFVLAPPLSLQDMTIRRRGRR